MTRRAFVAAGPAAPPLAIVASLAVVTAGVGVAVGVVTAVGVAAITRAPAERPDPGSPVLQAAVSASNPPRPSSISPI